MNEGNRRPLKTRSKRWAQALAAMLAKRKISPNVISTAGIIFALIGGACLLASPRAAIWLLGAAIGVQLRLLCNMLDGLVAVEGGLKSRGGDLFNEMPDRVEDIIFLVCAGYAAEYGGSGVHILSISLGSFTGVFWGAATLGWANAMLAVLTAYIRAFGGSLTGTQDFSGPCAKPQRMFLLTVGCLAAVFYYNALEIILWLIAIGTLITCIRRTWRLWKALP